MRCRRRFLTTSLHCLFCNDNNNVKKKKKETGIFASHVGVQLRLEHLKIRPNDDDLSLNFLLLLLLSPRVTALLLLLITVRGMWALGQAGRQAVAYRSSQRSRLLDDVVVAT